MGLFFLNNFLENKVENKIKEAGGAALSFENLDISLLQRKLVLEEVKYKKSGKIITAPKVVLKGIQFLEFLSKEELVINHVLVKEPNIIINNEKDTTEATSKFSQNITIKNFEAINGKFRIQKNDSTKFLLSFPEFQLSEVLIDSVTINEKIPFSYNSYHILGDSLRLEMDELHEISAGKIILNKTNVSIKDFRITPLKDKGEFQNYLDFEKDRITLLVDSINMDDLKFDFINDSLHLNSPNINISGADIQLYRDKTLPDNTEKIVLYGELLKKASVRLNFENIEIEGSKIAYEERISPDEPAAGVNFHKIRGKIENFTNIQPVANDFPPTKINLHAIFMEVTPISLEWTFNVGSTNEEFLISGVFGTVPAPAINNYLSLSMNIAAQGKIESLAFTFSGNDDVAKGDVQVKYDNFQVVVLDEEGEEKKGFLTAIANLFVDNDGNSGSYTVEDVKVTRDKTKSFWNYIWSGIKKGFLKGISQF